MNVKFIMQHKWSLTNLNLIDNRINNFLRTSQYSKWNLLILITVVNSNASQVNLDSLIITNINKHHVF